MLLSLRNAEGYQSCLGISLILGSALGVFVLYFNENFYLRISTYELDERTESKHKHQTIAGGSVQWRCQQSRTFPSLVSLGKALSTYCMPWSMLMLVIREPHCPGVALHLRMKVLTGTRTDKCFHSILLFWKRVTAQASLAQARFWACLLMGFYGYRDEEIRPVVESLWINREVFKWPQTALMVRSARDWDSGSQMRS